MNISALVAVSIFAGALLIIFGVLYLGALKSYKRGELDFQGIRILRWALLGHIAILRSAGDYRFPDMNPITSKYCQYPFNSMGKFSTREVLIPYPRTISDLMNADLDEVPVFFHYSPFIFILN